MNELDRNSPIPLYHQLAEDLQALIREGKYGDDGKIPSEHELASAYGVGRPTVRQAVDSLVRKGALLRRRGSGTYVAPARESVDLFSLAGTMASFSKKGLELDVELLQGPELAMAPKAGPGDPNPLTGQQAIQLRRLSRLDQYPVLVEDIYLFPALFPGLESMDLTGQSLSRIVQEQYRMELAGGEQRFRIGYPEADLAGLLDLDGTTPILLVNRFLHFTQARNAVYSVLFCRTDRFVFTQTIGGLSHA